jgi:hypothetical protein
MKDNLRDAAQVAYRAMIAAELSDGSRKEWEAAVDGLKAALAEPVVKESLTTQSSNTPRTDAARISAWGEGGIAGSIGFSAIPVCFARQLERELAAAIAQRDNAREEAAKGLMDCKGYSLYPDGTLRPAHGLGEWVRAIDYDKLHATATTAQADAERYRWLRAHDVLCWSREGAGRAPIETSHGKKLDAAIDAAMKGQPEAAVVFNKTLTGCEIKLTGGGGGGGGGVR